MLTPDGGHALVTTPRETRVVDLATGDPGATVSIPADAPWDLRPHVAPEGTHFSVPRAGGIEVRAIPSGTVTGTVASRVARYHLTGRHLLGARGETLVTLVPGRGYCLVDAGTGAVRRVLYPYLSASTALSAGGTRFVAGGVASPVDDGFVAVVDATTGRLLVEHTPAYSVWLVDVTPDGRHVLAMDDGGPYWLGAGEVPAVFRDARVLPGDLAFCAGGAQVIAAGANGLWRWARDAPDRLETAPLPETRHVHALSVTDAGDLVAVNYPDHPRLFFPAWRSAP